MAAANEDLDVSARILLQPIAAPRILGLYGFSGAWLVVGAYLAGWYGSPDTPLYLFPIVGFLGGVAQFVAGLWAYRARDTIATVVLGLWGAFWLAYALLYWLIAMGVLDQPNGPFPEFAFWYIAAAWITYATAGAALAISWTLAATLAAAAVGATVEAVAVFTGRTPLTVVAGYLFLAAALLAWYDATALMFRAAFSREVLPTFATRTARSLPPVDPGVGEPGVSKRQ